MLPAGRFRLLAVTVLLLALSGCGEKGPIFAPVRGKVTLDGKPVEAGTIMFVPAEGNSGPPALGTIQKDGTFTLQGPENKGVVVGKHKVVVYCPAQEAVSGTDEGVQYTGQQTLPCSLPQVYGGETTTPLVVEVKSGSNDLPIELVSK